MWWSEVDQGRLIKARLAVARPPDAREGPAAESLPRGQQAEALERRARARWGEAQREVLRLLAEAEEQAQGVLARAEAAGEAIQAEARAAGFAAGREEGLARARQEAEGILTDARRQGEAIRQQAIAERAALIAAAEADLLALVRLMAARVIRSELTLRPEALVEMVRSALSQLAMGADPEVAVSPADLPVLEGAQADLAGVVPGSRQVALTADPLLERGDFVVRSVQGWGDGRVEAQVAVLQAAAAQGARGEDGG